MSSLRITMIDVGWGDSILLESIDDTGRSHFGLIDSNDTTYFRSAFIFLKRFFEKKGIDSKTARPVFDFVMLTHEHADHAQGLKAIIREFGTRQFWYPKSLSLSSFTSLIRFANKSKTVLHHEAINSGKTLPKFGDAAMDVLWPPYNRMDPNPNNNSIVLRLKIAQQSVILSGDAEEVVWASIGTSIPADTVFFKVPHHGSINGTFDASGKTPWLNRCPQKAVLGISAHIKPHQHPDQRVIDEFDRRGYSYLRTDHHYHISFESDGRKHTFEYSHV